MVEIIVFGGAAALGLGAIGWGVWLGVRSIRNTAARS